MNLEMLNGTAKSQTQITITNPAVLQRDQPELDRRRRRLVRHGSAVTPEIYAHLAHLPLALHGAGRPEPGAPDDQGGDGHVTYMHSSGIPPVGGARLERVSSPEPSNTAALTLTGTRPDSSLGIVKQYFPEAVFNENQIIVNVNARFSQKFSVSGFYGASWANSDGGGGSSPSNS